MPCSRRDNIQFEAPKTIAVETNNNYCLPHICCVSLQSSILLFQFRFVRMNCLQARHNNNAGEWNILLYCSIFIRNMASWQGDGLMNMHKIAYATRTAPIKALNVRSIESQSHKLSVKSIFESMDANTMLEHMSPVPRCACSAAQLPIQTSYCIHFSPSIG